MEKKFDINESIADVKEKAKNVVNEVSEKTAEAIQWGIDNPETVIAIIGATAALVKASQSLVVNHRVRVERNRIDHTYYDPSTGFHWDLCRKATNTDRMQIQARKAKGEDMYHILRDLRLIK